MLDVLETEHLILRKAREDDVELIWKNVWCDPEMAKTMLWPVTPTLDEAKERIKRTMKYHSENYAYFVCLKENDEPIDEVRKVTEFKKRSPTSTPLKQILFQLKLKAK